MLYDAASPLKYIFYAVIGGLTLKPFVIPEESGIHEALIRRLNALTGFPFPREWREGASEALGRKVWALSFMVSAAICLWLIADGWKLQHAIGLYHLFSKRQMNICIIHVC